MWPIMKFWFSQVDPPYAQWHSNQLKSCDLFIPAHVIGAKIDQLKSPDLFIPAHVIVATIDHLKSLYLFIPAHVNG